MSPSINKPDQDVVVFYFFKSMKYNLRLFISIGLIIIGMAIQYFMMALLPGILLVLAGNLLLLVKGYDNRIKIGKFNPHAKWEKVDPGKFNDLEKLHKKMKKWDKSAIDITSGLGVFFFFVLFFVLSVLYFISFDSLYSPMYIIATNILVLIMPYWFTGMKRILTKPNLILKIQVYKYVLQLFKDRVKHHNVDYYMLLQGEETRLPNDTKIRVSINGQKEDFLGLYAQIATNEVNGTSYPYFYTVLVAKKGFELDKKTAHYSPPNPLIKEFNIQDNVEVLVIRQFTTKKSGYHTKNKVAGFIFNEGLKLAESVNKQ